jgi:translation initiation factor 4E
MSTTTATTSSHNESTKRDNHNKEHNVLMNPSTPLSLSSHHSSGNPLEYSYSFWFSKRPPKSASSAAASSNSTSSSSSSTSNTNYDANLKLVGTFNTVEKFWSYYAFMTRPHDLNGHADIHLFKDGIRPLWEDDANKNGGKWIVRLKKGLSTRCWENLILAILGEQFMVGEEICGAVVSIRFQASHVLMLL